MLANMQCFGASKVPDEKNKKINAPFGIDLGTTNSAISVGLGKEGAEIITLTNGKRTMPSVVAWRGGDNFIVGQKADEMDPDGSVIRSVKRLMQDASATVELCYNGEKRIMTPTEVSAEILKGLVEQTGGVYGKVKDVVVTVPAYFNQTGINNTRRACELAGLNCLHIMREPTAAALNYRLDKEGAKVQHALVYDLGGGTFDISLIRISERGTIAKVYKVYGIQPPKDDHSKGKLIEPQFIDGDGMLGGDDYDTELYKEFMKLLKEQLHQKHPDKEFNSALVPPIEKRRLTRKLCKAKTDLSGVHQLAVDITLTDGTVIDEVVEMHYNNFVNAFMPIYQRTKEKTNNVLRSSNCNVDTIILMGGSTKNPILTELLHKDYPGFKINNSLNPDESVAKGAGIKARNFMYGDTNVQIFDILPQSIGILSGNKVLPLIKQNSQLPITAKKLFTTTADNQDIVRVRIYQGNSRYPDECIELGEITIDGINPAPKGTPSLGIVLTVNADCILTCKAAIDGKLREKQLSLNAQKGNNQKPIEDKKVVRWRRSIKELPSEAQKVLTPMLDGYPERYSAQDIVTEIRKYANMELK